MFMLHSYENKPARQLDEIRVYLGAVLCLQCVYPSCQVYTFDFFIYYKIIGKMQKY